MDIVEFARLRNVAYRQFLRNLPALPNTIIGGANGGIIVESITSESGWFTQQIYTTNGVLNVRQRKSSLIGILNDNITQTQVAVYDLPGSIEYSEDMLVNNPETVLRRGLERLFESIEYNLGLFAIEGAPLIKIYGLKSHPNTNEYVIEPNGTGASANWSTKTPAQVYSDVVKFINAAVNNASPYPITHLFLGESVANYLGSTVYNQDGTLFINQVLRANLNDRSDPIVIRTIKNLTGMLALSSSLVRFNIAEEFHPKEHAMNGDLFVLAAATTIGGITISAPGAITKAEVTI